jgi:transcriptional regulator with XRE-family HTH domain
MDYRHSTQLRTANEWVEKMGAEIRALRLAENVTQSELARRANLDRTTVARMERGEGGSLKSLVQIARALGREEWLEAFVPPVATISPMQLLRARQRDEAQKRVRATRKPTAAR